MKRKKKGLRGTLPLNYMEFNKPVGLNERKKMKIMEYDIQCISVEFYSFFK